MMMQEARDIYIPPLSRLSTIVKFNNHHHHNESEMEYQLTPIVIPSPPKKVKKVKTVLPLTSSLSPLVLLSSCPRLFFAERFTLINFVPFDTSSHLFTTHFGHIDLGQGILFGHESKQLREQTVLRKIHLKHLFITEQSQLWKESTSENPTEEVRIHSKIEQFISSLPITTITTITTVASQPFVRFYGSQTNEQNGNISIFMEAAKHGDLVTLLSEFDSKHNNTENQQGVNVSVNVNVAKQTKYLFTLSQIQQQFTQLLRGIYILHHNLHICHRDLSLENIVVDEHYHLKICDFGLAQEVSCTTKLHNTNNGGYVGKISYQSPEVLANQPSSPYSNDIWACGIILWALVFQRLMVSKARRHDQVYYELFIGTKRQLQSFDTFAAHLKNCSLDIFGEKHKERVNEFDQLGGFQLLARMLWPDPKQRCTIEQLVKNNESYFVSPLLCD